MTTWEIIKLIAYILWIIIMIPFWWAMVLFMFYSIEDLIRKIKEFVRVIKDKDINKE